MRTAVLGGGIAGLAYLENSQNEEVTVYEKSDRPGGLCKSFHIDGFTFDSAVHLSFTQDKYVRERFNRTNYEIKYPNPYNYYKGNYIKHPIINNLYLLDAETKCRLIESFIERNTQKKITSYGDWLEGSYGTGFKSCFYDVYTKKYWTAVPEEMSASWVGERLQTPNLHKILYGAFSPDTGLDYYAKDMRYPTSGGYESFLTPMIRKDNIQCKKEAVFIEPDKHIIKFADGTVTEYDNLVSSLPLPIMAEIVKDTPKIIQETAKRLVWTKISIISIGFHNPEILKYLWMYIYDPDIFAARINSPSQKSRANSPAGYSSLQFEIYHQNSDKIDRKLLLQNTKYALNKMNLCSQKDVIFMDYKMLPFGNVIFYKGMEKDRQIVKDFMEHCHITMIGRFGEWDYLWSDQSYLSGMNAAMKRQA